MKFSHTSKREKRVYVYHAYNVVFLQIISQTTQSTTELIRRKVYKIDQGLLDFSLALFWEEKSEIILMSKQNAQILNTKVLKAMMQK